MHAGQCEKFPDHLSALAGVPINWNNSSEFKKMLSLASG